MSWFLSLILLVPLPQSISSPHMLLKGHWYPKASARTIRGLAPPRAALDAATQNRAEKYLKGEDKRMDLCQRFPKIPVPHLGTISRGWSSTVPPRHPLLSSRADSKFPKVTVNL